MLESPVHGPKISVSGTLAPKIYGHIVDASKRHTVAWTYTF